MAQRDRCILCVKCPVCRSKWGAITFLCFMRHYNACQRQSKRAASTNRNAISSLECGSCSSVFSTNDKDRNIRLFRHHLVSTHSFLAATAPQPSTSTHPESPVVLDQSDDDALQNAHVSSPDHEEALPGSIVDTVGISTPIRNADETIHDTYRFVLEFLSDSLFSQTATQRVVEHTTYLLNAVSQSLVEEVKRMQSEGMANLDRLLLLVNQNSSALESLSSQFRRYKLFEERGWRKPVAVNVGHRLDSVVVDGKAVEKSVPITYQYMPVEVTLRRIISNSKMKAVIKEFQKIKASGLLRNLVDGSKFFQLSNDGHLLLALYCDDIEVINPLGANSGVHKLCMYYISIANLPPELLTTMSHIHLLAVAHSQDVKSVGHNAILSRFLEDMQNLQKGVNIDGEMVKASLAVICADNLAANSIVNMTESFVSDHYCRFCRLSRKTAQKCCKLPSDDLYRSKEFQKEAAEAKSYGVKGHCALDELKGFSSVENFSPDIMHDLLEGVCRKELALMLSYYLREKYFTIEYLNGAINSFNYSYTERSVRPRIISKPVSGVVNLKESASMMLMLMRILPFLIGHLVPECCPYWTLFKQLREILDMVLSPLLSADSSYYLEELIRDHHSHFLHWFPAETLSPKHHFMIHYGEAIRRCGPLRHLWCMRYESRHQLAKRIGDLSNNFRNIALTVATQYSLASFANWELGRIWPITTVGKTIDSLSINSLCYRGVLFKPGCVINHGRLECRTPILSIVNKIQCEGGQFQFLCHSLVVDSFCRQYCSYPVSVSNECCQVLLQQLTCAQPLFIHDSFSGEKYVFLPSQFTVGFTATHFY